MSEVALLNSTDTVPLLMKVSRPRSQILLRAHSPDGTIRLTSQDLVHCRCLHLTVPCGPRLQTLKAQGYSCIPAYRNIGLHPYAIALAEGSFDIWGEEVDGVLCLLRWPDPNEVVNMEMPIAVMGRGERKLRLVARSPTEYTKRVLVEEDRVAGTETAFM